MNDIEVKANLGARIRFLRHKVKLSQEELAFRADIERAYISDIENGRRNIAITNINKIANALEVTLAELFNFKDSDN